MRLILRLLTKIAKRKETIFCDCMIIVYRLFVWRIEEIWHDDGITYNITRIKKHSTSA